MSALLDTRRADRLRNASRAGAADETRTRRAPWGALAVAGIVLVATLLLWTQAIRVGAWTNDEDYFVQLSRVLAESFPEAIWDLPINEFDERGIQRLTILLLAVPLNVINGETGLEIARALMCLGFALAAVPAYLLARGVGLRTGWALAAAALVLLVPWATLTSTFLTESVAYTMALWAIWGAWRATVTRGVSADLLALGLAFGAGFARTNLLVLAGVAPAAIVLRALVDAGPGPFGARVRSATRMVARDHPLLGALFALGVAVVALNVVGITPGPLARLSGSYVVSLTFDPSPLPAKFAFQFARMTTGMGVLPALLGAAWIAGHLGRRGTRAEAGLAAVGLFAFLLVGLSTVYAANEERYLLPLVGLFIVCGVVALARRSVGTRALVVAAIAGGFLVARLPWAFITDPSRFVVDPADAFFSRVVMSRLERLPGDASVLAGLLVALAVVALAVAWRRGAPRVAAASAVVALAAVFAFQAVQTGYAVVKHAELAGGPALGERAWVDEEVGDARVASLATGISNSPTYTPIWRELAFWNRRADLIVSTGPLSDVQIPRYGRATELLAEQRTGALRRSDGGPFPRYVLVPTLFRALGLLADPVRTSQYLPLELVRLRGAPRATFQWDVAQPDGWLTPESPTATVRVFEAARAAAQRPCLRFTLIAPANYRGIHRYEVRASGFLRTGAVRAERQANVEVPITDRTVRRIRVRASGAVEAAGGRMLSLQIANTVVGGCR